MFLSFMDIISHILFAHIVYGKQVFSLEMAIGAVFQDLDRIYSYSRKRFFGAKSRTFFHELPFISAVILIAWILNFKLFVLGVISHVILDFITGHTKPFYPFYSKDVNFNLPLKAKLLLGVVIWVIGLNIILS